MNVRLKRGTVAILILIVLIAFRAIVAFFGGTMVAEAQFISDGLVGRWTFDAITGGKIKDVVGANDGAVMGKPRLVEGQIRSALRFTGADRIEVLSAEELLLKDFTVDAWIKADEAPHNEKNSRILAKGTGGENYALTWHHQAWNTLSQSVSARTIGGWLISSSTRKNPLVGEEWYNIVGSYDGRNIKIYVNTELRNSKTWVGTPLTDSGELVIGAIAGGTEGFEGLIDEVKIYNRALTDAEIIENFERAKAMAVEYSMAKLAVTWGEIKVSR